MNIDHKIIIGYAVMVSFAFAGFAEKVLPTEPSTGLVNSTSEPPKELIDSRTSEQVLELIVKIAEHPTTWKQIHRVLETLEANNAAYSQRVDTSRSELSWMNRRSDLPGDKRNDVPDEKVAAVEMSTATPTDRWDESIFQHWKNSVLSITEPPHPQLKAIETQPIVESTTSFIPSEVHSGPQSLETFYTERNFNIERKFEERLRDIEEELKKLAKISRLIPKLQKEKGFKSSKNMISKMIKDQNTDVLVTNQTLKKIKGHPRFQYHRVNDSTGWDKLNTPNNGKRIILIEGNEGNQSVKRSIVAISLSPSTEVAENKSINGTLKPFQEISRKPCKIKKIKKMWKHKRRQLEDNFDKDIK